MRVISKAGEDKKELCVGENAVTKMAIRYPGLVIDLGCCICEMHLLSKHQAWQKCRY
jgi:hypothetical protein